MRPVVILRDTAVQILTEPNPVTKIELGERFAAAWSDGLIVEIGKRGPLRRPASPLAKVAGTQGDALGENDSIEDKAG